VTQDDQPGLFELQPDPVAHARRGDPYTSHAAAASLPSDKIRASQEAVLAVYRRFGPMTQPQLLERYAADGSLPAQSPSGLRTRSSELVALGLLRDSGRWAVLPSGRKSIIWELP
jgi:hypothetical protein